MSISAEEKVCYLREAAIVLAKEGFQLDEVHTDRLCILLDGSPLCEVTESGGVAYRNEDIDEPERIAAKDKVYEIVRTTAEVLFVLPQILLIGGDLADKTSFAVPKMLKKKESRGRVFVDGRVSGEINGTVSGVIRASIDGDVNLKVLSGSVTDEAGTETAVRTGEAEVNV